MEDVEHDLESSDPFAEEFDPRRILPFPPRPEFSYEPQSPLSESDKIYLDKLREEIERS